MSFIEDAQAAGGRPGGKGCGVARMLGNLDAETATDIRAALDHPGITASGIAAALKARFGTAAPLGDTVRRHRRGVCSCDETSTT